MSNRAVERQMGEFNARSFTSEVGMPQSGIDHHSAEAIHEERHVLMRTS